MCSPAAPKQADPIAAARVQGAENRDTALYGSQLSNPNIIGPEGTRTVTYDGNVPTITNTLSPAQQGLYDQSVYNRGLMGSLSTGALSSLNGTIGQPFDMSGLPPGGSSSGDTRQKVLDAMMGRYDTEAGQKNEQTQSDLVARGINSGTEAYTREMDRADRARNDYRTQAESTAGQEVSRDFQMDTTTRDKALQEMLTSRSVPINELYGLLGLGNNGQGQTGGVGSGAGAFSGTTATPAPYAQGVSAANQQNIDAWGNEVASANNQQAAGATIAAAVIAAM
jgi:hypothetical protein